MHVVSAIKKEGVGASEVLLELMVRIASHPDQWDRVHRLLQTIDQDLKTSRSVVTQLQSLANSTETASNSSEKSIHIENKSETPKSTEQGNTTVAKNETSIKTEKKLEHQLPWPSFDENENIVKIVNSNYTKINETKSEINTEKTKSKPNKAAYPKNFTYHRVTGKPDSTSKNPRAYIAVSVIAPKTALQNSEASDSEEDVALENELHQLKPWSHIQNLKNMQSIRSDWAVQRDQKNKIS